MKTYSQFRPTGFDSTGLGLPERQSWLVLPCGRNRDSDCLTESNFHTALALLGGESESVEVHRFGHWANGWFEIIIVDPTDAARVSTAQEIESSLDDYPILDENDFSEREETAANETWEHCYSVSQRIEYIRANRSQFEFRGFADLLGSVRGKYFGGYASELLAG
jgi:hypothetical protein